MRVNFPKESPFSAVIPDRTGTTAHRSGTKGRGALAPGSCTVMLNVTAVVRGFSNVHRSEKGKLYFGVKPKKLPFSFPEPKS